MHKKTNHVNLILDRFKKWQIRGPPLQINFEGCRIGRANVFLFATCKLYSPLLTFNYLTLWHSSVIVWETWEVQSVWSNIYPALQHERPVKQRRLNNTFLKAMLLPILNQAISSLKQTISNSVEILSREEINIYICMFKSETLQITYLSDSKDLSLLESLLYLLFE